jgi:hypothetical protein
MKVHLTSLPGYSKEKLIDITSLLNEVIGELEFFAGEPLSQDQLEFDNQRFMVEKNIDTLSFEELFRIGSLFRIVNVNDIVKDDFVIVLTPIPHNLNWFSGFSRRNIFVDVNGWSYITGSDDKYGIAYQVIENIFQSLININIDDVLNEPNIHHDSIGCINDMCSDKSEVMVKLRTGYICNSCMQRAYNSGLNTTLLSQILNIIQNIRMGLMNFDLIKNNIEPLHTIVSESADVVVGEQKLKMEPLAKTLFVFFLSTLEGVPTSGLMDFHQKLLSIYRTVRKSGQTETIDKLCLPYESDQTTFPPYRSTTNKLLINQLGKELSEFYLIKNVAGKNTNRYKILLPPEYLTLKIQL